MQTELENIIGKETVSVFFEDGTTDSWVVRQIRVKEYPAATKLVDDEIAICAIATDQPRSRVELLSPNSYESLQLAVRKVNESGFFAFAGRARQKMTDQLNAVSPELLQGLIEKALPTTPAGLLPK